MIWSSSMMSACIRDLSGSGSSLEALRSRTASSSAPSIMLWYDINQNCADSGGDQVSTALR